MHKSNLLTLIALLTALACLFSACGPKAAEQSDTPTDAVTAATVQDRAGNQISVPAEINKIISMGPSITETLIALGLSDKIIAIDTYSVGLEGLKEDLPQFDMMTPDTEQLIAMQPDIIFATGMSMAAGENPYKPVTDAGVCLIYVPTSSSIEEVKKDLEFIGQVTQNEEKAAALVTGMQDEIDRISEIGKTITDKKKVYFELSAAPQMYSFGKNTFLNEMLEIIGAQNIFADADEWISVSEESVVEANPDIIFTNVDYIDDPVGEINSRSAWSAVNAVKNGQVYQIAKNPSSLPNHNIILALTEMAEKIYPEIYAK